MGGRGGGSRGAATSSPAAFAQARSTDEATVLNAYAQVKTDQNEWVRLSQLRPLLAEAGMDRERQDQVLLRMASRQDTHLIDIANSKSLTQADHAAQLRQGGGGHAIDAIGIDTKAARRRQASQRRLAAKRAASPESQARARALREMVAREVEEARARDQRS